MLQPQFSGGDRNVFRLQRINRARHPRLHIAKGASAGAGIAQNHYGRVLLGPALADVRTRRLFTHGRQVQSTHQRAGFGETRRSGCLHPYPVGFARARRARGGSSISHAREIACGAVACHPLPSDRAERLRPCSAPAEMR